MLRRLVGITLAVLVALSGSRRCPGIGIVGHRRCRHRYHAGRRCPALPSR